jgi:hypothetical protein
MTQTDCRHTARVDAHFAGTISIAEEAEMRRHLREGCPTCQLRYTRLAMVAKMQPDAAKPEDRLAAGLGFRRRTGARRGWVALGLVLASAILTLLLRGQNEDQRFAARGPAMATAELRVFRVRPGASSERVVDRVAATDELAFAYRNGTGKHHLFVFGVDEHNHVFWFSPAWTSASEHPAAPAVMADGAFHEIEDAVGHSYDGARLDIYALFTDRAWEVEQLEARFVPAGVVPSLEDEVVTVQRFEVTR